MLDQTQYITVSGNADGPYQIVTSGNTEIVPRSVWVDKADDIQLTFYADISGNATSSSNTLLTVRHTNAAMIYLEPIGIPAISLQVDFNGAGSPFSTTLYYQTQG